MKVASYIGCYMVASLTVLAFYYSPTSAVCLCNRNHIQSSYCNSKYVVRATIVHKKTRSNDIVYTFKIERFEKITRSELLLRYNRFVVERNGACNIDMVVGKTYLVMGRSIHLDECTYVKEYDKLTEMEHKLGLYSISCQCQISYCLADGCLRDHGYQHECEWSPDNICQTSYSWCHKKKVGNTVSCAWNSFMKCPSNQTQSY